MNIYISGLSFNVNEESLRELFTEYGEVTSANVIMDKYTGNPRGFAFVEMSSDADGQKAIDELNDTEFKGKTISVNVARPRTERNDRGQGNRGSGGYNRTRY